MNSKLMLKAIVALLVELFPNDEYCVQLDESHYTDDIVLTIRWEGKK